MFKNNNKSIIFNSIMIYKQNDEIPIGSPTSGMLSEIFLQELEEKPYQNIKLEFNINMISWYVDEHPRNVQQ